VRLRGLAAVREGGGKGGCGAGAGEGVLVRGPWPWEGAKGWGRELARPRCEGMRPEKVGSQGDPVLPNAEGGRSEERREGANSSAEEQCEGLTGSPAHGS